MKKFCILFMLILLLSSSLFAIGFGYHVIEARAETDFGYGIFPISLNYQFNFPVPDFIGGSSTELAFRLDNGLDFRELRQDPNDGSFYALKGVDYPTSYMTIYDEFKLFYNQGFWDNHITLGVSVNGRFENSYERMTWIRDGNEEGLFWDSDGKSRFSSFIGAPELEGNRSSFQTYIAAMAQFDFMNDEVVRRKGARLTTNFRITGPWAPLNDGTANFWFLENILDLSYTLFSKERGSGKGLVSLVLDNSTTWRYISGGKVPYYIQGGEVWNDVYAPNTSHIIVNRLSLTLYGPQLTVDTYPSLSIFLNVGYSYGRALNSEDDTVYSEFVAVGGVQADFVILDIIRLYARWAYVLDPAFNESRESMFSIGFTFGI